MFEAMQRCWANHAAVTCYHYFLGVEYLLERQLALVLNDSLWRLDRLQYTGMGLSRVLLTLSSVECPHSTKLSERNFRAVKRRQSCHDPSHHCFLRHTSRTSSHASFNSINRVFLNRSTPMLLHVEKILEAPSRISRSLAVRLSNQQLHPL